MGSVIEFKPEWQQNATPEPGPAVSDLVPFNSRVPVIIAEDDIVSRTLLIAVLRKAGYDPIVALNGRDAMTALRQQTKACIAIVDWMMPEMDGAEVCRRARASGKLVHIIMLTARNRKEDTVEALDAGADDYLVKPFNQEELLARVRAGIRTLDAQSALGLRADELEGVIAHTALPARLVIPL
ncbi:MAG: response regulator transcription factor [Verrucomicrobiota bacterium]